MKRIPLLGIVLLTAACRTAPAPPVESQVEFAPGPLETAESVGVVERMHADGEAYAALVLTADGSWELLRLEWREGAWVIVDRTPASEDYLWPAQ